MIPPILTIAGSDSGGGAGIQADVKAIAANGGYAVTALTSVTAQNTLGVFRADDLSPDAVRAQLDAIFADFPVAAAKTGMLPSSEVVACVVEVFHRVLCPPLVVDPVIAAKSGYRLSRDDAVEAMKRLLFPLATVVTPNVEEAALLTGRRIVTIDDARDVALALVDAGCRAVVVKGGHLPLETATDLLYDGTTFHLFSGERLSTRSTHGTGCTFSAALATFLGRGFALSDAVAEAKAYVREAIRHGLPLGRGNGPTNHFWRWFPS